MRIVIVGAGVAGCVMARRLSLLDGVEVTCLERVSRDDHSEAGTGLNVGPNAVKALKAIDPELAERITEASFIWHNWRISLTDGTVLFDLPLANVADGPGLADPLVGALSRAARGGRGKRVLWLARSPRSAAIPPTRARPRLRGRRTARRIGSTASIS